MSIPVGQALPSYGAPTLEGLDFSEPVTGQRVAGKSRQFVRFYNKKFSVVKAKDVQINEKTGSTKILSTQVEEKEVEMVEIITPGDSIVVDQPAEDYHRREYWKQYKAFRDNNGAQIGKNLDHCNYVAPSIATELRYLGCHTEEQLADASDLLCNRIANGFELREFARAMQKADKSNESLNQVNALKAELEKSQETIKAMAEQHEEMKSLLLDLRGEPMVLEKKNRKNKDEN